MLVGVGVGTNEKELLKIFIGINLEELVEAFSPMDPN